MGRIKAALGSLVFLVLAPGVVAGLMPWLITHWRPLPPSELLGTSPSGASARNR
jgi:hypothetical protein